MNAKFLKIAKENQVEFDYFLKVIFPVAMKWEGGGKLHNVPGDTGGWTVWGIAYNKNKQHFDSLKDHNDTTKEEAGAFAFVEYYIPLMPYLLPKSTKMYAFDISYNMGLSRAKTYIQQCIGVTADGIFGNKTIDALPKLSLECLHKLRVDYYQNLGSKPSYKKFLKGWLNRANDVYKLSK